MTSKRIDLSTGLDVSRGTCDHGLCFVSLVFSFESQEPFPKRDVNMATVSFDALKTLDWGTDLAALNPIEDAIAAAAGKPEALLEIEAGLLAILKEPVSRDAQDYICRKLSTIGTAASVPALAPLLVKPEHSHMARFALQQISTPEAAKALRDAITKVDGKTRIGIVTSVGARRDAAAVKELAPQLKEKDPALVTAAAVALGSIATPEAVESLRSALGAVGGNSTSIVDALLNCAEAFLASNQPSEANSIYQSLNQQNQPRLVRLAATRGLLACASKQA